MEKLNARELAEVLKALGESSSGGKSDLYTRLEAILINRNMNFEDAAALMNVSKTLVVEGDNELTPGDSISQVGDGCIEMGRPDGQNNLGGGSILSGKRGKTGSIVSRISRVGSCLSTASAMERRRELEVRRKVQAAAEEKAIHIEKLRMQQQLARQKAQQDMIRQENKLEEEKMRKEREIEEERRRLEREIEYEKRRREMQEMKEEMELEMEIKALERQAKDDALRVEADAWAQFEAIDMEAARSADTMLNRLNVRDSFREQSKTGRKTRKNTTGATKENRITEWDRINFEERYNNCLLYTSPSPRDKRQSRMPSSA